MTLGGAAVGRAVGGWRLGTADAAVAPRRKPTAQELAWITALPCAAVVVLAIVLLGPPLGRVIFQRNAVTYLPSVQARSLLPQPEPTEQARYLLALLGPLLLTGAILLGKRFAPFAQPVTIRRLVVTTQVLALGFVVACYVVQDRYTFNLIAFTASEHAIYFKPKTVGVAAAIGVVIGAALASEAARHRMLALLRETPTRRVVVALVAAVAAATWLLPAINFEDTIGNANRPIATHIAYWLDEVFAVLDGRAPLVDFAAQYGSLWPYPLAGAMALLEPTIGVFTIVTAAIGLAALLAVFALLRRVARSSVAALSLFLPFLATGLFMMEGPLENRYAISNLFSTFPLRYAGPLLLALLVGRRLDGAAPRRDWILFLAAGVVLFNNADFGIPAFGATVAALLWTGGRLTLRSCGRLSREVAIGVALAFVAVSAVTLVQAGSLPHLMMLFRYSRLFVLGGWGLLPMTPTIGISTVIYLTYTAAIATASVRAANDEPDRLMTGLLVWSGVFGLGIGSYYMGRSHPEVLTNMFAAWALSIALLFVLAVRAIAARAVHRPTLPEAACLLAFGVLVCSLAQLPTPWSQVRRLQRTGQAIYAHQDGEAFIAANTREGETVAILPGLGHRLAYKVGVVDVTPYSASVSMPTLDQMVETLDQLQAAGGRKVFINPAEEWLDVPDVLRRFGYYVARSEARGMTEFLPQG